MFTYRSRTLVHNQVGSGKQIEEKADYNADFNEIHDKIEAAKDKSQAVRAQKAKPKEFEVGSYVIIRNEATDLMRGKKLKQPYNGILIVVEDRKETLELKDINSKLRIVNKRMVKPTSAGITNALQNLREKVMKIAKIAPLIEGANDITAQMLMLPDS